MRTTLVVAILAVLLVGCVSVQGAYRGTYQGANRVLGPDYVERENRYVDENVEFLSLLESHEEELIEDPNLAGEYGGSVGSNSTEYGGAVNGTGAVSNSSTTEYQGEYQGSPVPPPPSNNGTEATSNQESDGIDLPASPDRVYNFEDCKACGHFVGTLTDDSLQDKLTRYEIVLQAQTMCQQNPDTKDHLKLSCNIFDEVEAWLVQAKVIQHVEGEVQEYNRKLAADVPLLTAARDAPISSCELVSVCGKATQTVTSKNGTQEVKEEDTPKVQEPTTFIMRFQLSIDIENIPRSSDKWRVFVVTFLHDIANVLSIPPERLQLHAHVGDQSVEVIIRPLGANDPVLPDGSQHNAHHPSKELAVLFKKLVAAKDPSLETANKLLATINTESEVEVLPLLIANHQ